MSVGSKIKALRKKRGLTQDALAENIISRSMLSRIESGSAEPSISSLKALADRLGISAGYLLEDSEELLPAERSLYAKQLFDKLGSNDFAACLEIFSKTDFLSKKEFAGIYVHCSFSCAVSDFFIGDFSNAKTHLENIKKVLPTVDISVLSVTIERINVLYSVMENITAIESISSHAPEKPDFTFQPSLFLFMLKLLGDGRISECTALLDFCELDSYYFNYIKAQILIKDYKFIDAIILLKGICTSEKVPLFLKLLCYSSMESCCKLCEDYKGAYENRLQYTSLLGRIK